MKFKHGVRKKPIEYEKSLIRYWKKNKTFEKSVVSRPQENTYVFYDGPPFITGVPHHGTLLSSVVKDAVPRYWTMKGKRVERVWGWDCHGLPAEVFTEKKLGIQDKRDIGTKISLEEYILTCRANMVQTGSEWEDTIDRIGRWVDFRGAYKTMDKDYMESVWWAFKKLYEAGKIYEGERVLLYCVRDATPISKAEVAMDNSYQDIIDPSVYVKFKLSDDDAYLLAWTTTPWTLPANVAVAVNKDLTYAKVEVDNQRFILAKELLDKVLVDGKQQTLPYKVLESFKGKALVGKKVTPLFENHGDKAHMVYHEDYVGIEEGTGVVHSAPAYGEEDFIMAQAEGIPVVSVVDEYGFYSSGEWQGQYVWDIEKTIAKSLLERGIVWRIEYVRHSYPHCHRCGTKLMYKAHPSWFMDIDGQRSEMLEQNRDINWFPRHIKHGRFQKTVENAPDWNLSRDRFWATAMPVWKATDKDGNEHVRVVGSYAELKELSGIELEDYHRPWVDEITFNIGGLDYRRIDKVLDCWFESGSMPFAQFHYPFENRTKFEQNFPGDFVAEYVGQVRAWFYYMHAVNVGLFGKKAFYNVIVTGTLAGNDGRKMSKSYGNYTDPNELMDRYSADALRFLLLSSPVLSGEDYSLQDKNVADVSRKLAMVWNVYDFFTMYADVDAWEWNGTLADPSPDLNNPLDKWVVSKVHELMHEIDGYMKQYDLPNAVKPILPFIDDVSNWYVRRSRRRFWKTRDDADKNTAYRTLHYVLVQLSLVMAPFTPFLAEELYRNLTGSESVHLKLWPRPGHIDKAVVEDMGYVREVVRRGLAERAQAGIRVRQPLAKVTISNLFMQSKHTQELLEILKEELNVKKVILNRSTDAKQKEKTKHTDNAKNEGEAAARMTVELDLQVTPALKREGMAREVIRYVQSARKQAGLKVDDRIVLALQTDSTELKKAISQYEAVIKGETLTKDLVSELKNAFQLKAAIEEFDLSVALKKSP